MNWLEKTFLVSPTVSALLVLSVVIFLGLALGAVKVRGVGLSVAGVLFSGLLFGHLGLHVDAKLVEFSRDFGLVLFVYAVGMQAGPGFFAAMRKHGLALNAFATAVVLGGLIFAAAFVQLGWASLPASVGLFSGGTTNTPSLGAAVQALRQMPQFDPAALKVPSLAYAVAYPFGIIGTILAMLVVRSVFRIDVAAERAALEAKHRDERPKLQRVALVVENAATVSRALKNVPGLATSQVVVSRVARDGVVSVATPEMILQLGDVLVLVGRAHEIEMLSGGIGRRADVDVSTLVGAQEVRRVIVTQKSVLGKTAAQLGMLERLGVTITRIVRGDQEFSAASNLRLQFGDVVMVVGNAGDVALAAAELGDSEKQLNTPQVITVFLGIALGLMLGSLPLAVPGLPSPLKLGLAGGPLVAALLLSRIGHIGPLVWHLPANANHAVREIGIVLFLASVGLICGDALGEILVNGEAVRWMLMAAALTFVPLVTAAILMRAIWKTNFVSLCGLIAGSMTDPPALAFATQMTGSENVAAAYVTVYPFVMVLRIFSAQILVLLLAAG